MALNSFTIYLLKDGCTIKDYESYLEDKDEIPEITAGNLPNGAKMRYAFVSSGKVPDWVSFWGVASSKVNATARALVFIPVKTRIFVLSYGFGYVHLNLDYIERDFGLETVKRVVESSSIKSAATYNLSLAKKQQTQFVSDKSMVDFEIDYDNTLVKNITGNLKDSEKFDGKVRLVTGADSLHFSCDIKAPDIESLLEKILVSYQPKIKRGDINLSGGIKQVSDGGKIKNLYIKLEKSLLSGRVEFSLPGLLDFSKYSGCSTEKLNIYDPSKLQNTFSKTEIKNIYEKKKKRLVASTIEEILKKVKIYVYDEDGNENNFSLINCLTHDIKEGVNTYFFHEGCWYNINKNFIKKIETETSKYIERDATKCHLPVYTKTMIGSKTITKKSGVQTVPDKGEGNYNEKVCNQNPKDIILMDKDLVILKEGKFEPCDLVDVSKNNFTLIHVKIGLHSSMLSHLFFQGLVSTRLLVESKNAQNEFEKKFPQNVHFQIGKFSVLYAVLVDNPATAELPLFSKISFWKAIKEIEQMGKKVKLVFVESKV